MHLRSSAHPRAALLALPLAALTLLGAATLHAGTTKPAAAAKPAAKPSAPAAKPAASSGTAAGHTAPGSSAGHPGGAAAGARPGGNTTATRGGGSITHGANGRPESFHAANGNTARFDAHGNVHEVHAGNTTIVHGPGGARRIESEGPGHVHYVADARGHGYVQRPYMFHGHAFEGRTYYRGGIPHREFYRPYYYHGVYLHGYYPAVYYRPAFYGWAYAPWAAPVPYAWGWGGAPWYAYYGPAYFAPYPVYASPSLWLTDYIIAANLQAAYSAGVAAGAAGAAAGNRIPSQRTSAPHLVYASYSPSASPFAAYAPPAASGGAVALSPEIKQEIANEVQLSLNAEKDASAQQGAADAPAHGIDQVLADGKPHVFVASDALTVPSAGAECGLTAGDVLQISSPLPASADSGQLQVLASKSGDCTKGSSVTVTLDQMQEMHNNLLASLDTGLGELSKKAGQNGIPAAPAGSTESSDAPYAQAAPPEDPDGAQQLAKVAQEGKQADDAVTAEAAQGEAGPNAPTEAAAVAGDNTPHPASGPVTIALGQTPAQVKAGKGEPKQVVNLGAKQIYVYSDMKVIFVAGKVSDVQ